MKEEKRDGKQHELKMNGGQCGRRVQAQSETEELSTKIASTVSEVCVVLSLSTVRVSTPSTRSLIREQRLSWCMGLSMNISLIPLPSVEFRGFSKVELDDRYYEKPDVTIHGQQTCLIADRQLSEASDWREAWNRQWRETEIEVRFRSSSQKGP